MQKKVKAGQREDPLSVEPPKRTEPDALFVGAFLGVDACESVVNDAERCCRVKLMSVLEALLEMKKLSACRCSDVVVLGVHHC